jgi:hypothetical protein
MLPFAEMGRTMSALTIPPKAPEIQVKKRLLLVKIAIWTVTIFLKETKKILSQLTIGKVNIS